MKTNRPVVFLGLLLLVLVQVSPRAQTIDSVVSQSHWKSELHLKQTEGVEFLVGLDYGLSQTQIDAGVDGIIVGGTTGEGHLLSWEEHLMLIAHSVHQYGEKLIVVGNTGSNNTREAIKATENGFLKH